VPVLAVSITSPASRRPSLKVAPIAVRPVLRAILGEVIVFIKGAPVVSLTAQPRVKEVQVKR